MGEGNRSVGLGGDCDRTIDGNRLAAKERDRQEKGKAQDREGEGEDR